LSQFQQKEELENIQRRTRNEVQAYNPSYLGGGGRKITSEANQGKSVRPYLKTNQKQETLSSNPSAPRQKKYIYIYIHIYVCICKKERSRTELF
jgi:hypothetical protein